MTRLFSEYNSVAFSYASLRGVIHAAAKLIAVVATQKGPDTFSENVSGPFFHAEGKQGQVRLFDFLRGSHCAR